ncbi:hypothetical protein [Streptomyces erythrochromogenes]|uniref:hypothetical protein n=1 Tax=Streptomyces erythrochromogenes TaxID=285574 RepID=UPI003817A37D
MSGERGEARSAEGDLQEALAWGRQRLEEMGVFAADDGLRWAAAHGLVLSVWRNGPIEDAHAARPTRRRKGLPDGAMFARNTWLTRQVFDALGSDDPYRLYRLEDLILDREAVWPGCGGTLTDFGWGFLGEIQKHVKKRIDQFAYCEEVLDPEDFLVFAGAPRIGTHVDHYGMPQWPACVEAALGRLRGEDQEFWREWGELMERVGPAPDSVTADLGTAGRLLLEAPWELGSEILGWFAWNPVLSRPVTAA